MDTYRTLLVDAFADEPLAGTTTGVVPEAAGLSTEQMQAVASELAASETAFVLPSGAADRRLRFFSPGRESTQGDDSTVAALAHLFAEGDLDPGSHTVETEAGEIEAEIGDDGVVWLPQDAPQVEEVSLDHDSVAAALGIDAAALQDVGWDVPLAVASTGVPFLLVPVNFLEHLGSADPDPGAVEALVDECDAAGVYAFTFDALGADSTVHARCFRPGPGSLEATPTVAAGGACGAYLRDVGVFDDLPEEFCLEQGHFLDRPGTVRVQVTSGFRVGGGATVALEGTLAVPREEEDGIIEA